MPVPKKRTSKMRRNKRRAHHFITPPNLSTCPNCAEKILPHRVCPFCGYYKGRAVKEVEEV